MFNKLMLLLPLALFTRAWKFWSRDERLLHVTVTNEGVRTFVRMFL